MKCGVSRVNRTHQMVTFRDVTIYHVTITIKKYNVHNTMYCGLSRSVLCIIT